MCTFNMNKNQSQMQSGTHEIMQSLVMGESAKLK